jgi:phosphohistidine phosphatase
MKTLYIVRHAKSSHENGVKDWERPLADSGVERANKISGLLKKKKISPDKIISSHAFRALNTAIIFAMNLDYPVNKIDITDDLYETNTNSIVGLIKKQSNEISSLMIFGHNPAFTDLYNELTGENMELSTSSAACIQFDVNDWNKIQTGTGKSIFIETGK